MDKKRQGEIALAILKLKLRKEGVRITPDLRREVGNEAKKMGIPFDEAMKFTEIIVREMVEETFAKPAEK